MLVSFLSFPSQLYLHTKIIQISIKNVAPVTKETKLINNNVARNNYVKVQKKTFLNHTNLKASPGQRPRLAI